MGEQSTARSEGAAPDVPGPGRLRSDDWRRAMETSVNVRLAGAPRSMADVLEEGTALDARDRRVDAEASDGWTLRIKPDRRQVQLPMASGQDRRRR